MAAKVLDSSDVSDIKLLQDEAGGLMMESGISTITFYKGDFAKASAALRVQFGLVVQANPWLTGKLVTDKRAGGTFLRHPTSCNDDHINEIFSSISINDAVSTDFTLPTQEQGYDAICTEMYKANKVIVESGYAIIDKDKPVVLLTLAESKAGEFALIFSMSHVVGDGRTLYEILKMLAPGTAVRGLPTERIHSFHDDMLERCNRKALGWVESTSAICHMLPILIGCGNKAKCYAFTLDAEKVAAAKEKCAMEGGVEYVSTNDILTSGFFNVCNTRIGMMGFDCRGKVDGIGADFAGNYVTALVLDDAVFGTPASLRKMYATSPYESTGRPLPGCCLCERASFAVVSNWSSFAGDLVPLADCELVMHLPIKNPAEIMWDEMIPFSTGTGKQGVICWTVSTDEAGLRDALPVGESVSSTLFP